jgi:hypothetical protein
MACQKLKIPAQSLDVRFEVKTLLSLRTYNFGNGIQSQMHNAMGIHCQRNFSKEMLKPGVYRIAS